MFIANLENFYICQNMVFFEFKESWKDFKENITEKMSYQTFLNMLDNCKTKGEIRKLTQQFI